VLFPQGATDASAKAPPRESWKHAAAFLAAAPVVEAWRAANPDKLRTADQSNAELDDEALRLRFERRRADAG
jgi:hypothetical protein